MDYWSCNIIYFSCYNHHSYNCPISIEFSALFYYYCCLCRNKVVILFALMNTCDRCRSNWISHSSAYWLCIKAFLKLVMVSRIYSPGVFSNFIQFLQTMNSSWKQIPPLISSSSSSTCMNISVFNSYSLEYLSTWIHLLDNIKTE